ncbi:efflux RND transporter periplasmic adaptor subunit [Sneathiella sp.]|uniref:efflux RND transporter periplasmic adaptor subunit n=1 Tax=Sneathiella sp. TaxID=1964365 RepID=UPI002FE40DB6
MNRSIIIAIVIALSAVAWIVSGQIGGNEGADASIEATDAPAANSPAADKPVMAVRYRTFTASAHQQKITVHGKTEANRLVEIKAEVAGRVDKVHVDAGDRVKKGDVIVSFDLKDNEARLQEAEALVRQREIEFNAAKQLNQRGFSADTTLASAKAQLDSARAQMKAMTIRLNELKVKAPFDGVIEKRSAEIGDYVLEGNPIATIVESDPLLVTGEVSELQVGYLKVGGEGVARLATGETVTGRVKFVGTVANPETRTFRIELEIPNEGYKLRSGVTAAITFNTASVMAHLISPAFLTLDDKGVLGLRAVGEDETVVFYPVTLLTGTDAGTWVSGLPETVSIIVVGQDFVRDGDKVRPTVYTVEAEQ